MPPKFKPVKSIGNKRYKHKQTSHPLKGREVIPALPPMLPKSANFCPRYRAEPVTIHHWPLRDGILRLSRLTCTNRQLSKRLKTGTSLHRVEVYFERCIGIDFNPFISFCQYFFCIKLILFTRTNLQYLAKIPSFDDQFLSAKKASQINHKIHVA